ncbi:MAG: hypothetical protein KC549_16300 [Myxococcales bacterium]|nr:hypothetical protein [Myxococcales bacterium]MCB9544323.1 hypothetical protein [Myxococcales bacterium]
MRKASLGRTAATMGIQAAAGAVLGVGGAAVLGVGDGWELPAFALGAVVGVGLTGVISRRALRGVSGAVVGAGVGAGVVALAPGHGFLPAFFPTLGALLGYWILVFFSKNK